MEHSPEATETTRPGDALARLGRFLRRPPTEEEQEDGQETMEIGAIDLRDAAGEEPHLPAAMWGGYDRAAVDARIAELEDELADLRARHDPDQAVEQEIRHLSDETGEILRVAHSKADAMVKQAQAQAETILADAQARADAMVMDAEERRRRIDQDTELVWNERMRMIDDTRLLADQLRHVADSGVERFPPEPDDAPPLQG